MPLLPKSQLFSELDWNKRYSSTADAGDASITDADSGALSFKLQTEDNLFFAQGCQYTSEGLMFRADGTNKWNQVPELATYRLPMTIPASFTFEFDINIPENMPKGFSGVDGQIPDHDDRIFVGAVNHQGYTAGLLFSSQGVALAPSPYTPYEKLVVLQGSQEYVFDDDGNFRESLTVRTTIDGDTGRISVYITDTKYAYASDSEIHGVHSLRWTLPAQESSLGSLGSEDVGTPIAGLKGKDQILVAVRACNIPDVLLEDGKILSDPGSNYVVNLSSLRLGAGVIDSPDKPYALTNHADQVIVGRRFRLDGRGSFDPAGLELSYKWEVIERPNGSTAQLTGGVPAFAKHGAFADGNAIVFSSTVHSALSDGIKVEVTTSSGTGPQQAIGEITPSEPNIGDPEWETSDQVVGVNNVLNLIPASNSVASMCATIANRVNSLGASGLFRVTDVPASDVRVVVGGTTKLVPVLPGDTEVLLAQRLRTNILDQRGAGYFKVVGATPDDFTVTVNGIPITITGGQQASATAAEIALKVGGEPLTTTVATAGANAGVDDNLVSVFSVGTTPLADTITIVSSVANVVVSGPTLIGGGPEAGNQVLAEQGGTVGFDDHVVYLAATAPGVGGNSITLSSDTGEVVTPTVTLIGGQDTHTLAEVIGGSKVRITADLPGLVGNGYTLFSSTEQLAITDFAGGTSGELASDLKVQYVNNTHVRVVLKTTSMGVVLTTAQDIVAAFTSPGGSSYNSDASGVVTASLGKDALGEATTGKGLAIPGTYTVEGGAGSKLPVTSIQVDKTGIWRFMLVVNNGVRDSDPVLISVWAVLDGQLLQHRPKSDYIWKSLPDFWNLLKDQEMIETFWSSATQTLSGELLKLLQNDYAKSIRDISRKYKRRWLSYSLKSEFMTLFQDSLKVVGNGHFYVKPNANHLLPGSETASFKLGTNKADYIDLGAPDVLIEVEKGVLEKELGVVVNEDATRGITEFVTVEGTEVVSTMESFKCATLVQNGSFGKLPVDPNADDFSKTALFSVVGSHLNKSQVQAGDLLLMELPQLDGTKKIISRYVESASPEDATLDEPAVIPNTLKFTLLAEDGAGLLTTTSQFRWQVVRLTKYSQILQMPYFDLDTKFAVDLVLDKFGFGDYAQIEFENPLPDGATVGELPILTVSKTKVFLDWRPFFGELNFYANVVNDQKKAAGENTLPTEFSFLSQAGLDLLHSARIKCLYRTEIIPLQPDIVSIPFLGTSTIVPEFAENRDYEVIRDAGGSVLRMLPIAEPVCAVMAGSNEVHLDPPVAFADAGNINSILFEEGEVGHYGVLSLKEYKKLDSEGNIETAVVDPVVLQTTHTFKESGTFKARIPRFGFGTAQPPERLWAEATFFDNWRTIESNFGLYVGLPKKSLTANKLDLDYLSTVKSAWFAFLTGPSVYSIKGASEAFMGLPVTDKAGLITVLSKNDSDDLGRFVVKQVGEEGYQTYFYPKNAPIGTNPTTGRTLKAASVKKYQQFWKTTAEKKKLENILEDIASGKKDQFAQGTAVVNGKEVIQQVDLVEYYTKVLQHAEDVDDALVGQNVSLCDSTKVFDYVSEPDVINSLLTGSAQLEKFHTFAVQVPQHQLGSLEFLPLLKEFVLKWKPAYTNLIFFGVKGLVDEIDVKDDIGFGGTLYLEDGPHTSPFIKTSPAATAAGQTPKTFPEWVTGKNTLFDTKGPGKLKFFTATQLEAVGFAFTDTSNLIEVGSIVALPSDNEVLPTKVYDKFTKLLAKVTSLEFVAAEGKWMIGIELLGTGGGYALEDPANPPEVEYNVKRGIFDPDVFDKYESSYVCGALDDWSGDGSWNEKQGIVDMVNTVDSDIDVLNTLLWVPIEKYGTHLPILDAAVYNAEFTLNEPVQLGVWAVNEQTFTPYEDCPWASIQKPRIRHCGVPEKLMLPGEFTPQNKHPFTYLVLKFYEAEGDNALTPSGEALGTNNYGHEDLLRALQLRDGSDLWVRGTESGAIGKVQPANPHPAMAQKYANIDLALEEPSDENEAHIPYFIKETIFSLDKILDAGPWIDNTFRSTQYIPVGGIASNAADPQLTNPNGGTQLQGRPYVFNGAAKLSQMAPSFGPGLYAGPYQLKDTIKLAASSNTDPTMFVTPSPHGLNAGDQIRFAHHDKETPVNFGDTNTTYTVLNVVDAATFEVDVDSTGDAGGGSGGVIGLPWSPTDLLSWDGYYDVIDDTNVLTDLDYTTESPWQNFNVPSPVLKTSVPIKNVHIGTKRMAHKGHHATHGFVNFRVPKPFFVKIGPLSDGFDVRIEGYFLVADDPTRVEIPTANPAVGGPYGFDGTIGGSWVFFREADTQIETPVQEVHFETGHHAGKSVINIDGVAQKSDGHILEVNIPDLANEGFYDIVLRQYRPYQLESGGATQYHVDEIVAEKIYYYSQAEGFAGDPWGNIPFGGA